MSKNNKWYIHQDRDEDTPEIDSYSITLNPEYGGWTTDSGYQGYGLPKEMAIWICKVLNESEENAPYKMDEYGYWIKDNHLEE